MIDVDKNIKNLRALLDENEFSAYLIPSSDPHQSEYVADHWASRAWISGFTGSAGIVIITKDHAGLWTDSRYFVQAEKQLKNNCVELHKQVIPHAPEHIAWLCENLPEGAKVGFDGMLFSQAQVRALAKAFYKKNFEIDYSKDLIAPIWKDRPPLPSNQVFEHALLHSGQSRKDKIATIREKMQALGCSHHLVTSLDDIAWLLNIRSSDVKCNPVSIAYVVIADDRTYIFIDSEKISAELKAKFVEDFILLKPYDSLKSFLQQLPKDVKILVDQKTCNIKLYNAIAGEQIVSGSTISTQLKGIKNDTEIRHLKETMAKDGVALLQLYRWLEQGIQQGSIPETAVAEQLIRFRKTNDDYFGESFEAIVGYNGNGAIVHYRAEPETCAQIKADGILLIDSGGQYHTGTTDITRTTALGSPTAEQKKHFTLVLKGHIGLATLKFPHGTKGVQMDILARQHLWQHGLNYGHGTGHGVGFFLNVHEGPQGIAPNVNGKSSVAFEPGMITSNEPGFYKDDAYGIRIENLVLVVKDEETDFGDFLRFETITLFPIDLQLVDPSLLVASEKNWLNNYHKEVYEKLAPRLNEEERAWLKDRCRAI